MSGLELRTVSRGSTFRRWMSTILIVVVILGVAGGGIVYSYRDDNAVQPISRKPVFGEFASDIIERGDVESSSNTELRCEISSAEGVRILEIVPEGTQVKIDDVVVQLDDSTIRKELTAQRITVNTIEAAFSKAKNDYDAAVIARKEYELGTFVQEEQKLQSELFVAEENSRRAANFYEHSKKLATRGYITETQLEGDRFAVEKNSKDLGAAKTKLMVLRDYTRPKTMKKHDSDIKTAEAHVTAEEAKHKIELEKLSNLESQLEKCVIRAKTSGQVVYHNPNRWMDDEFKIRKGNRVRERQIIVKLPDPGKMQVKAKIGESRVDRVKPGMPVVIRVEALRGEELTGTVKSVSAYASDENWFNPNTKEYDAIITIDSPPVMLKPGMSAQVSIRVETLADVLQAPVQAVVERGGKHYCVIKEPSEKLALRELMIGSTNDKFIIIKEGLAQSDEVVMNPRAYLAKLGLKDVEPVVAKSKTIPEGKAQETPAAK